MRDEEEASSCGKLLEVLQSVDFVFESLLTPLLSSDRASWTLATLLEAWKAACRLRLLAMTEPGHLLRSQRGAEAVQREALLDVARRVATAASPLQFRAGGRCYATTRAAAARESGGLTAMRAGEWLHVLQPTVYIAMVLAQLNGVRCLTSGWRRRLPYLTALIMELVGLQLCVRGWRQLQRERTPQARALATRGAQTNERELVHRRTLLALFLLRPAVREAVCRALSTMVASRRLPWLAAWCRGALEMGEILERAIWARGFRTMEQQLPP